jgi:uncharacterized protein YndB with AHSA1/START domain
MRPKNYSRAGSVPAPIERVFAVLTDARRMPEWLPGCSAAQSEHPLAQGVWLRARFKKRVSVFEVIEFRPPERIGFLERGQRKNAQLLFGLEAAGAQTTVTVEEVWQPADAGAWVRGHVLPKRDPNRYLATILENLGKSVGAAASKG